MIKYDQIKPYIEKGLISERSHPTNPDVQIFNYTPKCQFDAVWDDITMQCRGLILNVVTGELLALPFKKFFNYDEHVQRGGRIPLSKPIISEKLDGSLGILYWLDGEPWIATRGSFESEQALWDTDWLRKNLDPMTKEKIMHHATFLFEIVAPWNRIVVNYDYSGLVLLGMIDWADERFSFCKLKGFRSPKTYSMEESEKIKAENQSNFEGFVFWWPLEGIRVKFKLEEYKRLHRIVTGVSEIAIWEQLRDGESLDEFLKDVPDEFYRWVESVEDKLNRNFRRVEQQSYVEFGSIEATLRPNVDNDFKFPTRKDWAEFINRIGTYPNILFAMLDHKDYRPMIWKGLRPRGQRVFKTDIDL